MKNESAYRTWVADELRRQGVEIEMTVEETAVYLCPCGATAAHPVSYLYRGAARTLAIR